MNDLDTDVHDVSGKPFTQDFRRTATDDEFDQALANRSVLDVAVGITMRSNDCRRDLALAHLHRVARTFDITVLELARGLIESSGKHL
ncbi:ANTAR domain-containing protein [Arthrobacter sp. CP30]